jgi:hypothetical protein
MKSVPAPQELHAGLADSELERVPLPALQSAASVAVLLNRRENKLIRIRFGRMCGLELNGILAGFLGYVDVSLLRSLVYVPRYVIMYLYWIRYQK